MGSIFTRLTWRKWRRGYREGGSVGNGRHEGLEGTSRGRLKDCPPPVEKERGGRLNAAPAYGPRILRENTYLVVLPEREQDANDACADHKDALVEGRAELRASPDGRAIRREHGRRGRCQCCWGHSVRAGRPSFLRLGWEHRWCVYACVGGEVRSRLRRRRGVSVRISGSSFHHIPVPVSHPLLPLLPSTLSPSPHTSSRPFYSHSMAIPCQHCV